MYQRCGRIPLRFSTSGISSNLCCLTENSNKRHYAVIHRHLVSIATTGVPGDPECRQVAFKTICEGERICQPLLYQVRWVILGDRTVFVMVAQVGVQIFDITGTTLLYFHSFIRPGVENREEIFGQGIAGVGINHLCVGTSYGNILVFQVPPDGDITFLDSLEGHEAPVTCLSSDDDMLVSADDMGKIAIWKDEDGTLKKLYDVFDIGLPVTSLKLWKSILVIGFSYGQLKIYNIHSSQLVSEINAHSRAITAVDIASDTGLILSVSEDTFIRVWHLKKGSLHTVSHKYCANVPDCALYGGCFLGSSGSAFCVTGYDLTEILCYRM